MRFVAAIYLTLFLISNVNGVDGAISCTPQSEPELITTEIANPEFTVNFDNVFSFSGSPIVVSSAGSVVDVTLQGLNCIAIQGFGLSENNMWINTKNWYPENDASPDMFVALNANSGGYCELVFSEPISYFSICTAASLEGPAGIFIYDASDQELNCKLIPWMGEGGHDNSYAVRGYSSATKTIKRIRMKDCYAAMDLLRGSRCSPGRTLVDGSCLLPCEMNPAPCGENTDCTNVQGSVQCTCKTYYTGNAIAGCTPKTCMYSAGSCNQYATCSNLESEPYFSCSCNDGYTGDGYGAEGCTAIPVSTPIDPPVDAPVDTPISEPISEPISTPVSTPVAPVSAPTMSTTPVTAPTGKVSTGSVVVNVTPLLVLTSVVAMLC